MIDPSVAKSWGYNEIFLDAYLNDQTVFYGSLLAAIVLFLLGAILVATPISFSPWARWWGETSRQIHA